MENIKEKLEKFKEVNQKLKSFNNVEIAEKDIEIWLNMVYLKRIDGLSAERFSKCPYRDVIKAVMKDNYGLVGTIHYSLDGSPPKLHLLVNSDGGHSNFKLLDYAFRPIYKFYANLTIKE